MVGRLLRIRLSTWSPRGIVTIESRYQGPGGDAGGQRQARDATAVCCLVIYPMGGDTFALATEVRSVPDGSLQCGGTGAPWEFTVGIRPSEGQQIYVDADVFMFHLGSARFVRVHLLSGNSPPRTHRGLWVQTGPLMTSAQINAAHAGGPMLHSRMQLDFGAGNILHVDASPPVEGQPLRKQR